MRVRRNSAVSVFSQQKSASCCTEAESRYWDWSLDWEDIFQSPIWDNQHGFGGNGNTSLTASLNYGRCVTTGPFANLHLSYAGHETIPHCLTRGFETKGLFGYSGQGVSPAALDAVLAHEDHWSFWLSVEEGPHDTIPNLIRGDFFLLTAPNGTWLDPPQRELSLVERC